MKTTRLLLILLSVASVCADGSVSATTVSYSCKEDSVGHFTPSAPGSQQERPVFGAEVELVSFPVSVLGSDGLPLEGLTKDDFTIFDGGVERDVAILLTPNDSPLEVALLLDLSASMEEEASIAKQAALSFLDQLSSDDCVLYVPFNSSISGGGWSRPGDPLLRAEIEQSPMEGGTRLYDALVTSFRQIEAGQGRCVTQGDPEVTVAFELPRRRAVVVVTDGFDGQSFLSFEHVLGAARQVDAPVFPVGIGSIADDRWYKRFTVDQRHTGTTPWRALVQLQDLARITAGQYIVGGISSDGLDSAYEEVLQWLRSYFLIGYYAEAPEHGPADPELPVWHDVKIEIGRDERHQLHMRPGYYRSPTDRERARYHIGKGIDLVREELPAEALVEFDLAIHADPYYWQAYYRWGGAMAMLGNMGGARRAFLDAVSLRPERGDVHRMVSLTSQELGDYATAWIHAIRASLAGVSMTAEMQALRQKAEPPTDLDALLEAPRIYVQPAFAADPVANVALGRMLRTLRVAISETPGIGLTDLQERADYTLVIEPVDLEDKKPRRLDAEMQLTSKDGDVLYEIRLLLSDIDDQQTVAAELGPYIADLQAWLSTRDGITSSGS